MSEAETITPGQESAGEAAEPKEPEAAAKAEEPKEPNGDPLDDIKDPVARAEAKKFRAIARREARHDRPQEAPAAPLPDYAKKDDLALIVTGQAKELVSDEVKEHWDELMKIPLGGYNAMDARSIAQNMSERLVIFKAKAQKDTSANQLSTSAGVHGAPGKQPEKPKPTAIPRLRDVDDIAKELYGA